MIKGIGTDILEISRVNTIVDNNKFMSTYYTKNENLYIESRSNKSETAAALFCAKEAVAKALGTGFRGFAPKDIEIIHNDKGKPEIILYGKAKEISESMEIKYFNVSLSHCREYAVAFVTAEGADNQ